MEKGKCKYWLPKKKRLCSNPPLSDSSYCGNHTTRSDVNWVPCPIDPSHKVLEENVKSHIKRCPHLKQSQTLSLQPYYLKGINTGSSHGSASDFTSVMKRNLVHNMSFSELSALLSKIRSLHASLSEDIASSYKVPPACHLWLHGLIQRKLPYQEKHVLQQASIVGNLEDLGVLSSSAEDQYGDVCLYSSDQEIPAVVEFGAGRGYLTQILADLYGVTKVFLVERKSYKLKADRSLRQKEDLELERLRIDIEDLNLNAVESLKGIPYLAVGKHLCGPATDLTLRCCLAENKGQDNGTEQSVRQHLRGIAVATCCHHLCQWKHYTNRRYMMNLGVSEEDFHAITWFTSWAVDADHGSNISDDGNWQSQVPFSVSDDSKGDPKTVEDILRNMKALDRAALGLMCKDIIDMGRLMWVKECGLEAKLVNYVPPSISPENRLIVAKPEVPVSMRITKSQR